MGEGGGRGGGFADPDAITREVSLNRRPCDTSSGAGVDAILHHKTAVVQAAEPASTRYYITKHLNVGACLKSLDGMIRPILTTALARCKL